MRQAQKGDTVKVHYTGRMVDGTEFDSSVGGEPMVFTVGSGEVIPGFDRAVLGMCPGEAKTVTLVPEEAYGPYLEDMVAQVPCGNIPVDLELEVGNRLEVGQEGGASYVAEVTELTADTVTLDANHPLAGKDVVYEIRLVAFS